jgi:hypothetical protein
MGVTLPRRAREAWRSDGAAGAAGRAALYGLRRVARVAGSYSRRLDHALNARRVLREHGAALARNAVFSRRHAGRRCIILGNGPSLNAHDLSPLGGEVTFACNGFWRHPVLDLWRPTYYLFNDPIYFEDEAAEDRKEYLAGLTNRAGETTYLLPCSARRVAERFGVFPPERTYYFGACGDLRNGLAAVPPDFTRPVPAVRQVVQIAVMMAMYMGCDPIYLVGLDHDWLAHRGEHTQFYSGPEFRDARVEQGLDWWSYGGLMEAVLTMWQGYEALRAAAEGAYRIINLSSGGFLDVFPRGVFEAQFDREPDLTAAGTKGRLLT